LECDEELAIGAGPAHPITALPGRPLVTPRDLLLLVVGLLPASGLKVRLLNVLPRVTVHLTATIGPCLLFRLHEISIAEGAAIGALTVIRDLDRLQLEANAIIGKMNYVSAMRPAPIGVCVDLRLGPESAVTNRHYLDCSGGITVGGWTTIAGSGSSLVTHQIDIQRNEQTRRGIRIGMYCLISSDVRIAPGAVIGDRVLVAMGAVVSGRLEQHSQLYAGVPARPIRSLALDAAYWTRRGGVVREASQAGS